LDLAFQRAVSSVAQGSLWSPPVPIYCTPRQGSASTRNTSATKLLRSEHETYLDSGFVGRLVNVEISEFEGLGPVLLMQVHKHRLLDFRLPVVDSDRVIMTVQTMDQCLNGGFLDMTNIRGGLSRFDAHYNGRSGNSPEGVDDHLALDRLYGIDNDGHRSVVHHFEGLRESLKRHCPLQEGRHVPVGCVHRHWTTSSQTQDESGTTPPQFLACMCVQLVIDSFLETISLPPGLLEHIEHLGLEDVVHRFDADCCPRLRHREYVHHLNGARNIRC